jgi:hypothetical protein
MQSNIEHHFPSDAGGNGISCQRLIISYEKIIMVCKTAALTDATVKIILTDYWLHAMDTRT